MYWRIIDLVFIDLFLKYAGHHLRQIPLALYISNLEINRSKIYTNQILMNFEMTNTIRNNV